MRAGGRFILMAVAAGVAAGWCPEGLARSMPESVADVARKISPAVVNISTTRVVREKAPDAKPSAPARQPFDKVCPDPYTNYTQRSLGSGVIVDKRGYIVTNGHVVFNAAEIVVKMNDGREFQARLVGIDKVTDLAVIKVEGGNRWPAAQIGDSDQVSVGDWVVSAGSPFGFEQTITVGIISAKSRTIGTGPYDDYLQTDASINPGNSGGPLVDMQGRVIGITTAIVSSSGGSIGIGFAVPANIAIQIARDLIETGNVHRGWLGVVLQPVTQDLARHFGLKRCRGILISDLAKKGPADLAGLKRGDVILRYDGQTLGKKHKLSRLLAATPVGTRVALTVIRDGRLLTVPVLIAQQPGGKAATAANLRIPAPAFESDRPRLGLVTSDFDAESLRRLAPRDNSGVVVAMVEPGALADKAGLTTGDIIHEVNRRTVRNQAEFQAALKALDLKQGVLFLVERDSYTMYISVEAVKP